MISTLRHVLSLLAEVAAQCLWSPVASEQRFHATGPAAHQGLTACDAAKGRATGFSAITNITNTHVRLRKSDSSDQAPAPCANCKTLQASSMDSHWRRFSLSPATTAQPRCFLTSRKRGVIFD